MQLEVEAAGVAHGLAVGVAPPQGRRARVTVGAKCSRPLADDLKEQRNQGYGNTQAHTRTKLRATRSASRVDHVRLLIAHT